MEMMAQMSAAVGSNQANPVLSEVHTRLCSKLYIDKVESYRTHIARLFEELVGLRYKNQEYKKTEKIFNEITKTHHDDVANLNLALFEATSHYNVYKNQVNKLNVKIEELELELSKEK